MAEAVRGKLQLHWKMLIGFLAGLVLGLIAHYGAGSDATWVQWLTTYVTQPAGTLFLRLIFMLVIPLLFSALVIGVAEMGDVRALGRVGWRTLGYTILASGIAVVLGLLLVNWLQPGAGVDPVAAQQMLAQMSVQYPEAREAYRRESKIAPACVAKVSGFGADSYVLALEGLVRWLARKR